MAHSANRTLKLLVTAGALLVAMQAFASGPLASGPLKGSAVRTDKVLRQVTLIIEPKRLLASNVRLNRLDEKKLLGDEQYLSHTESEAAIVVATNRRILAYGPVIGWRSMQLRPGETVESLQAEDYAVFIVTDLRYLNFSADTGIWAHKLRSGGS